MTYTTAEMMAVAAAMVIVVAWGVVEVISMPRNRRGMIIVVAPVARTAGPGISITVIVMSIMAAIVSARLVAVVPMAVIGMTSIPTGTERNSQTGGGGFRCGEACSPND